MPQLQKKKYREVCGIENRRQQENKEVTEPEELEEKMTPTSQ